MKIELNKSLKNLNTFGIEVLAKKFVRFKNREELNQLYTNDWQGEKEKLILGGGSNILFTNDYPGLVLKNEIQGIEVVRETSDHVFLKIGAGENWHHIVLYCVDNNYGGIENLSLIPGNSGAAPMQNIGAYGVELKDVFHSLESFNVVTGETVEFKIDDCQFDYRSSIFKTSEKGKYVILNLVLRLDKVPKFNISYGAIKEELENMHISELSIQAISNAVINIRQSKLPDPKKIGNAGSFFKNPVVSAELYHLLKKDYPDIVAYENGADFKIAAGWLIDKAGWKGYRMKDFGVHKNQALVLVNYANAKGEDILNLSKEIQASVKKNYGLDLEREVNIY